MYMSLWEQFKSKANQQMLWDVLLDEFHINTTTHPMLVANIRTVFDADVLHFTNSREMLPPPATVLRINKDFLTHMITAVRKLLPNFVSLQNNRIVIGEDDLPPLSLTLSSLPTTVEDIHAARQREFEQEVEQKRMEFNALLMPAKPKEIDFSDKIPLPKLKKVSWENPDIADDNLVSENNTSLDIFDKLKQIATSDKRTPYAQQESSTLPQIKQEEIVRNQVTTINEPMLSTVQMAKQLNDMNRKIDNLIELVTRICNR
jgi:hypothetical protein